MPSLRLGRSRKQTGAVSLVYQWIDNTGHRLLRRQVLLEDGKSRNQGLALAFDYGVSERLSRVLRPPVRGREVLGPNLPPVPPELQSPNDVDGEWHTGFQDFALAPRYNAVSHGAFVLDARVALVIPSHCYDLPRRGVLGRRLKELQLGVNAGPTLDAISLEPLRLRPLRLRVRRAGRGRRSERPQQLGLELGFVPVPKLTLQLR